MYVCLLKHTYIHACLEVSDIHTYMLKQASRSSVCMYVCLYVWDSKLWSGGWVRFLTKNLQYLNDNSIFLRFVRGGTSGGSRQTYIHTCLGDWDIHTCLATWDIHTYMLSYLRLSTPCGAHELSYYSILMRRAKPGYVCMYTSINIVSLCISFWGSPKIMVFIALRLSLICIFPHRQRGFSNIPA